MRVLHQMTAVMVASGLLCACGGADNSNDTGVSENAIIDPYRLQTISELQQRLPNVEPHITRNDGEGLWLIAVSTEARFVSETEDAPYDITYFNHGSQVASVQEVDGELFTALCATPLEAKLGSDAPLSLKADSVTYDAYQYKNEEMATSDVQLSLQLNNAHRTFTGSMTHDIARQGSQVTYVTHLAGVKISNFTTFSNATSEFDIDFSLSVNDAENNLTDIGDDLVCMGGSQGVASGEDDRQSFKQTEDFASAMTLNDAHVEFFHMETSVGSTTREQHIFSQSIIEGQGDPFADGDCDFCSPSKEGALSINLNSQSTQLFAEGNGTDSDDETIALYMSFSSK